MMYKLKSVEPARYPVLRLQFEDGLSGEFDVGPEIAKGGMFAALEDQALFEKVSLADDGFAFGWRLDKTGREIDFSADAARADIETAAVKELAARYRAQRPAAE